MRDRMRAALRLLRSDETGLSSLERLGVASVILVILVFIPQVRAVLGDAYDAVFGDSVLMRGILIAVVSVVAFNGTGWLILQTNLGQRLAFLVTGAATMGWMTIGSLLFVIYAPRGLRPSNLEGLNAFQVRIPAIALTLGSFILFLMFVVALDRYERAKDQ